jgi:probable non-F420 flavinoid oxidoreductase
MPSPTNAPEAPIIGYHCSHEQHAPSALLENVRQAEAAGFAAAMCSDHFTPFSEAQGQSGFAWSWLGAALQATRLDFGTVTAPGQRYHPAIVAQAAATLCDLFPGRFWWALGSGQAINEHITGEVWPTKRQRQARLLESVAVIRALFRGETVTHDGLVRVREAKLYSRPAKPPLLVGAAVSAETARWVGGWADALITVARPHEELRKVVDAFRAGGGEGKPMFLQAALSYASTESEAERLAHEQWRTSALPSYDLITDTFLPASLDAASHFVRPEDVRTTLRVSASLAQHVDWIGGDLALGFSRIYLHHVGKDQRPFLEAFARGVLTQVGR